MQILKRRGLGAQRRSVAAGILESNLNFDPSKAYSHQTRIEELFRRYGPTKSQITFRIKEDLETPLMANIDPVSWNAKFVIRKSLKFNPNPALISYLDRNNIIDPVEKLLDGVTCHEIGHWEFPRGTRFGCPFDKPTYYTCFIEPVHEVLGGKDNFTERQREAWSVRIANAVADVIDNYNISISLPERERGMSGQVLFWQLQGQEGGAYSKEYSMFVDLNLALFGKNDDKKLLGQFSPEDNEVKAAIERLSKIFTHEKMYSMDSWEGTAREYAKEVANLIKPDEKPKHQQSADDRKFSGNGQGKRKGSGGRPGKKEKQQDKEDGEESENQSGGEDESEESDKEKGEGKGGAGEGGKETGEDEGQQGGGSSEPDAEEGGEKAEKAKGKLVWGGKGGKEQEDGEPHGRDDSESDDEDDVEIEPDEEDRQEKEGKKPKDKKEKKPDKSDSEKDKEKLDKEKGEKEGKAEKEDKDKKSDKEKEKGQQKDEEDDDDEPSQLGDDLTQEDIEKIMGGRKAGKGIPFYIKKERALDAYYKALAKRISIKAEGGLPKANFRLVTLTREQYDPEVHSPEEAEMTRLYLDPQKRRMIPSVAKTKLLVGVPVKKEKGKMPDFMFALVDSSGSMGSGGGNMLIVPWGDNSYYHYAILTFYGLLRFFESEKILHKVGVSAAIFSNSTLSEKGLEEVKQLLFNPQMGGTQLDMSKVIEALRGKDNVMFSMISDGEIGNWDSIKDEFIAIAKRNQFFMIQIGSPSRTCKDLETAGLTVKYVTKAEDIVQLAVNLTAKTYRKVMSEGVEKETKKYTNMY